MNGSFLNASSFLFTAAIYMTTENQQAEAPIKETTDLSVGEVLRRARMQYNLTILEVEYQLRIKALHLEALEKNDHSRLPGRVYALGFVRVYSEYLGLDGDKMVALFKKQSGGQTHIRKPELSFPVPDNDSRVPGWPVIVGSVFALLFVMFMWVQANPTQDVLETVPPVPVALKQQLTAPAKPEVAAMSPSVVAAVPAPEAVAEKIHPVVLKAEQDVWLEIRSADGKSLFSRVLKQGEEYWVPTGQQGLKMTTGNAGGLNVFVQGKPIPKLGGIGDVRRNVDLNFVLPVASPPSDADSNTKVIP